MQIKLNELIRAIENAHNVLLDLEELNDEKIDLIRADYEKLAQQARAELQHRKAK